MNWRFTKSLTLTRKIRADFKHENKGKQRAHFINLTWKAREEALKEISDVFTEMIYESALIRINTDAWCWPSPGCTYSYNRILKPMERIEL